MSNETLSGGKLKEQHKQLIANLYRAGEGVLQVETAVRDIDKFIHELRTQSTDATTKANQAEENARTARNRALSLESQADQLRGEIDSLRQQLSTARGQRQVTTLESHLANLTPGRQQSSDGWKERRKTLIRLVERYLPDIAGLAKKTDLLRMHQDAYAAGYHADEYVLLGMAVKYLGVHGVDVHISGTNGETFNSEEKAEEAKTQSWWRRFFHL